MNRVDQMAASRGFSIIELMIAMLIGSVLLLGMVSLFSTTSGISRMESGLARLQEGGRFAMTRMAEDIRMATSTRSIRKGGGGPADQAASDRTILSLVDFGDPTRAPLGLLDFEGAGATGSFYHIPRSSMLRGHECANGDCVPQVVPTDLGDGRDHYGGGLPEVGITDGLRADGADVLTLRYVSGTGASVARNEPLPSQEGGGLILLAPGNSVDVGPSGLVVINDYQFTVLLSVAEANQNGVTQLTPQGNLTSFLTPLEWLTGDIRVSDFDSSFVTVSYFLRLGSDPNSPDRMISSLVRRQNGDAQELVQGIERLDFRYLLEDRDGLVRPLSADEIDGLSVGFPCITHDAIDLTLTEAPTCIWRSVRAIEVFMLATTVDDVGASQEPFVYSFLEDGSPNLANTPVLACDPAFGECPPGSMNLLPSGLPPGRMLRREFQTVVTLRNNAF